MKKKKKLNIKMKTKIIIQINHYAAGTSSAYLRTTLTSTSVHLEQLRKRRTSCYKSVYLEMKIQGALPFSPQSDSSHLKHSVTNCFDT